MITVVADASPLNILIRIGEVDLLPKLFDRVLVPQIVAHELDHLDTPVQVRRWITNAPEWIEICGLKTELAMASLKNLGEQSAIQLALERQIELVLIDEVRGRKQARAKGLAVMGTVGIVERAAIKGFVHDLAELYHRIRRTDFRISQKLLDQSLDRYMHLKKTRDLK